ncbi:MAG: S9 family peptidase [Eubacteriaceae bacterium]|nr:S9 family peptidase [Eubacteriaceae bacterium]
MKKLTRDLFYNYHFLSALKYDDEKSRAAFCVSKVNKRKNSYDKNLWLLDKGDKARQITFGNKESLYVWEDKNHILYSALEDGKDAARVKAGAYLTVFNRLDVDELKSEKAFSLPLAVGDIKKIFDDLYIILATTDLYCPEYYALSAAEQQEYEKQKAEQSNVQVIDEYPWFFNGQGFINKTRNSLFLYDAAKGELKRLGPATLDVEHYDFCRKQKKVLISGIDFTDFKAKWSQVYEYDLTEGTFEEIYDGDTMQIYNVFYNSGKKVVLGTFAEHYGAMECGDFYTLENNEMTHWIGADTSFHNTLSCDVHLGGGANFAKNNGQPYFITTNHGGSEILTLNEGRLESYYLSGNSIDMIAPGNEDFLVVITPGDELQEIYRIDNKTKELTKVTSINEEVLKDYYVPKNNYVHVIKGNTDVDGWIVYPQNYNPKKKYPAILDIHGGPKCAYGDVFMHEMKYWANRGYIVFYCNPRGSDGRGDKFADLRHNFGKIDFEDIMNFTDYILETHPEIDQSRVAVTGGSYGGYMTNWIIGHTDRFVCAATQRSISNWVSHVTASDYGIDFAVEQEFEDRYNCVEELWEASPLKYANNIKTPTLFIHSFEDYRCPLPEAYQLYTTMKCRHIDSRMVVFKGENHELSRSGKPKNRSRRLEEITAWIEKYTK